MHQSLLGHNKTTGKKHTQALCALNCYLLGQTAATITSNHSNNTPFNDCSTAYLLQHTQFFDSTLGE